MRTKVKKAVYLMTATSLVLPAVSMAGTVESDVARAGQVKDIKGQAENLALEKSSEACCL